LVSWKIVPAKTEVWNPQAAQWYKPRPVGQTFVP
jgi:hypothetical protein